MMTTRFALLTTLICCTPTLARVTVEEARATAERFAGHSLAGAQVDELGSSAAPRARFREGDSPESASTWTVSLNDGSLLAWRRPAPTEAQRQHEVSVESAIALARDEAARALGPDADRMVWTVATGGPEAGWVRLMARGPETGNPPRAGLSPSCIAIVHLKGAKVTELTLDRPEAADPVAVAVTRDEAVEAARAAASGAIAPDAPPAEEPQLWQRGGRATWVVKLRIRADSSEPYWSYRIDAATGQVIGRDRSEGAPLPASGAHSVPWLPVAGGAGLVLVLAATTVALRRRRVA